MHASYLLLPCPQAPSDYSHDVHHSYVVDALYEKFNKRTVAPMAMLIVLCIIVLIGLLLLYRVLDPRDSRNETKKDTVSEEEEKSLIK